MNKYKSSHSAQSGFALGLILLVIILMAAVTASMSLTSGNDMSHVSRDRLKSYALVIKSHGAHIRDTVKSMERIYSAGVDLDYGCSGDSCLAAKVKLNKIPFEVFSPSLTGVYGYNFWASSDAAFFSTYSTRMFVLKRSLNSELCAIIESVNRGRTVNAADIPVAANFVVSGGGNGDTFVAQFNWDAPSQDGCFRYPADRYYYYIIIGTAS